MSKRTFRSVAGLVTYYHQGQEICLGYLLVHEGKVYDTELGRVDIDPGVARQHNKVFDQAVLEGLDRQCQVGQGQNFYLNVKGPVTTWLGTEVSEGRVVRSGFNVEFKRGDRVFSGRTKSYDDEGPVFFKRIS